MFSLSLLLWARADPEAPGPSALRGAARVRRARPRRAGHGGRGRALAGRGGAAAILVSPPGAGARPAGCGAEEPDGEGEEGAKEESGGGGAGPGRAKGGRCSPSFLFSSGGGGFFGAEEMDSGARPGGGGAPGQSREYKLVMLGAGGVGKSGAWGGGRGGRPCGAAPCCGPAPPSGPARATPPGGSARQPPGDTFLEENGPVWGAVPPRDVAERGVSSASAPRPRPALFVKLLTERFVEDEGVVLSLGVTSLTPSTVFLSSLAPSMVLCFSCW